jgi:hypothetical protein
MEDADWWGILLNVLAAANRPLRLGDINKKFSEGRFMLGDDRELERVLGILVKRGTVVSSAQGWSLARKDTPPPPSDSDQSSFFTEEDSSSSMSRSETLIQELLKLRMAWKVSVLKK